MKLWTLATLPQTIAMLKAIPGWHDQAQHMEKMYANFLPGGKYA
jgi:hypothetical protein